ncbi:5-deoxy-glucuronate isomerase [Candidatus Poribacteria bacterium]|nr:5-deoxy-glucuronate isomerase [Candidatus Poribacteria bacterium]
MHIINNDFPIDGYTQILSRGDHGIESLEFALLNLRADSTYSGDTDDCQVVLVTLGGKCKLLVGHNGNKAIGLLGNRPNVFSGRASVAFIPHHTTFEIITTDESIEIAVFRKTSHLDTAAVISNLYLNEDTSQYGIKIDESKILYESIGESICFYRFQHENDSAAVKLIEPDKQSARIVLSNNDLICLPDLTRTNLLSYQGNCYQLSVS